MSESSTNNRFNNLSVDLQNKIIGNIIKFPNTPVTFGTFFKINNLDNDRYKGCTFTLTGKANNTITLEIGYLGDKPFSSFTDNFRYLCDEHLNWYNFNLFKVDAKKKFDYVNYKFQYHNHQTEPFNDNEDDAGVQEITYQIITKLEIKKGRDVILTAQKDTLGGSKKSVKKEILGKLRCIYKIHGLRKEYVKHKGMLITVTDYKKQMKQ